MSVQIERKNKQKWSLNPRGKAWSEDSNKFGQKILEKLGWSHGKGLGAKEDGILEHIRIPYKNDAKGMGYKETDNQWTEHDSNFNALLQSLSGEKVETDIKISSSLEKKSQNSKVRVHYKKFTRGKDLSRCTEKDLASIFGKKTLKATPTKTEDNSEEKSEEKENNHDNNFTYSGGSMVDYFKKKLPNFGKSNGYVVGSNGVLKKDSESEEEGYVGFGFKTPDEKKRKSNEEISESTPKKLKSDEDKLIGLSNPAFDPMFNNKVEVQRHVLNTIEEETEEVNKTENKDEECKNQKKKKINSCDTETVLEESINNEVKKKKKKKKQKEDSTAVDNPNFEDGNYHNSYVNGNYEVKRKEKENSNDNFTYSGVSMVDYFKKKLPNFDKSNGSNEVLKKDSEEQGYLGFGFKTPDKKKRKSIEKEESEEVNQVENKDEECKSQKKKKIRNSFGTDTIQEESINDDDNKKKKKKQKEVSTAVDNPNFEDGNSHNSYVNEDYEVKRKKKKKNKGNTTLEDEESIHSNQNFEVKRKKKKKTDDTMALDNPIFDIVDSQDSYVNENFEVKRKKKKKEENMAIDNPNFDDTYCEDSCFNNNFEVKRKKKKKKKQSDDSMAIDNPNFNSSAEEINNETYIIDSETKKKRKNKEDEETSIKCCEVEEKIEDSFDLILNVTSTPSLIEAKPKSSALNSSNQTSSLKRRKSVRFSEVNEERIIPNNEDVQNKKELFDINSRVIENGLKEASGTSNLGFNNHQVMLEENIDEMSKKIDGFQAEIENDMNEAKVTKFIGEVGNPDGENEKLPEGTRLKFKYAKFGKAPPWIKKSPLSCAKTSYKHLIKGDIVLGFNNTNLHEIKGYAVNINSK